MSREAIHADISAKLLDKKYFNKKQIELANHVKDCSVCRNIMYEAAGNCSTHWKATK